MILSQHAAPRMLSLSAGPLHSRPPRVSKKQKEDREWGQNSGPLRLVLVIVTQFVLGLATDGLHPLQSHMGIKMLLVT